MIKVSACVREGVSDLYTHLKTINKCKTRELRYKIAQNDFLVAKLRVK